VSAAVALAVFVAAGAFAWNAFRPDPTPGIIPTSPASIDGTILWPERTGSDLEAVQQRADQGDPSTGWRLDPEQVTVRFAEQVLGWGEPEGRYAITASPDISAPGTAEFSLDRYAVPCPSPPPDSTLSNCPPPFERESVVLGQKATIGEGGIWSVTQTVATHMRLNVEPGDHLADGSRIGGALDFAQYDPPTVGTAGSQIGTEGDCFIGSSQPQSGAFTLAVRFPEGISCGSQPAYAWAATEPSGQVKGLQSPDPFLSSSSDQRTLYGLTAAPFIVGSEPSATATPPPSAGTSPSTSVLTSSGLVAGGTLRCTATFPRDTIEPGDETAVRFRATNVSDSAVTAHEGINGDNGWLLLDSGGQRVVDASLAHEGIAGPPPTLKRLAPGESADVYAWQVHVIWPGPLEVTPVCLGKQLPTVTLQVAATTAPEGVEAAVASALSKAGDPFGTCTPPVDGWGTGTLTFPGFLDPIDIRCGVSVVEHPGFDVLTLAMVAPPTAPDIDLSSLSSKIEAVPWFDVPRSSEIAVNWWVVVVTSNDAVITHQFGVRQCLDSASYAVHLAVPCAPTANSQGVGPTENPIP
jgi:hypothetical protein